MSTELGYVIVTPYTLAKSRTGGVLSRLLSGLDLELVATQIVAFSQKFVEEYAESMVRFAEPLHAASGELLSHYILENLAPSEGRRHRSAIFLFRGENVCKKLSDIVGALYPENRNLEEIRGETIRDTYAELVWSKKDPSRVHFFEPAVLVSPKRELTLHNLKLFADFLKTEENVVKNIDYHHSENVERTIVIIKPDNWRYPSSKPGAIIDMFAKTGLRIVGCKIYQMSIQEAFEFYGSVEEALVKKLGPKIGKEAVAILEKKYDMKTGDKVEEGIVKQFGEAYAKEQFYKLIEFMTGRRPNKAPREEWENPGWAKCMVLVYEGVNAVKKIRDVLGPTDPTEAPWGTIRKEFGSDVMINTAHASDSAENAEREGKIIGIEKNNLFDIIYRYLEEERLSD